MMKINNLKVSMLFGFMFCSVSVFAQTDNTLEHISEPKVQVKCTGCKDITDNCGGWDDFGILIPSKEGITIGFGDSFSEAAENARTICLMGRGVFEGKCPKACPEIYQPMRLNNQGGSGSSSQQSENCGEDVIVSGRSINNSDKKVIHNLLCKLAGEPASAPSGYRSP